ncbi:MAG: pyrimidine 5'-nucleotidase [Armatimonadota bacterium]|nr:pyrimidine 5'-nucleotidase [Armatimonadota bacterium]
MTERERRVDAILFDLDNTLYHPDCGLLEAGDEMITDFIVQRLGLDREEADSLRLRTWRQYGATARGLEVEHGVPQREFFAGSVERVSIERYVQPDPDLAAMLSRLPQRLYIFTNSTRRYAEWVLEALGVTSHFDRIFDIEFANGRPKPHCGCYERVAEEVGLPPGRIAILEDTEPNLEPATELGMVTIKVGPPPPRGEHLFLPDVLQLPQLLGL